jgi:branched-chain amino acid transport system ATP-binding protein
LLSRQQVPSDAPPLLSITDLRVDYDGFQVLRGVDLSVGAGEIVCILGPNGAGKSTLMNSISRLVRPTSGAILFKGVRIDGLATHKIVAQGVAHVLERRRLFPNLSVYTNLVLGAYLPHARAVRDATMARVIKLLPFLESCLNKEACLLSGGQQQQLALARGLMSLPSLLLLDEPFIGLSPAVSDDVAETIQQIRADGVTVLFIEQNVQRALALSARGYILESGSVALTGPAAELLGHESVKRVYLGH